jgi:tuftelin-interacting protein 11
MSRDGGDIANEGSSGTAPPLANWEKHTKGIGTKLLQKFGFKGRLGANETGIAKAIEVYVRPANVGLGFGDIDAPKESHENHILGEIVAKKESAGKKRKKLELEGIADRQGWKKQKYDSQKTQSKEIDEYLKEFSKISSGKTGQAIKIVDRRGQHVKIITDMANIQNDELSDDDYQRGQESPPMGAELLFNISKMFDLEKSKYIQASKRANEERTIFQSYKDELAALKTKKEADKRQLRKMTIILDILKELNQFSSEIMVAESLTVESIGPVMDTIRTLIEDLYRAGPQEFKLMGFMKVSSNILKSIIGNIASLTLQEQCTWLRAIHSSWLVLSKQFVIHGENALSIDCMTVIQHAVDVAYLPNWRQFVSTVWDGCSHLDEMIEIVAVCQSTLSSSVFAQCIDQYLIPKLVSVVQNWKQPLSSQVTLHGILIPWLPLLKDKLQPTFPEVRRKLSNNLRSWSPRDVSIIQSIRPWMRVFDKGSLDNLLSRVVIPKLVDFIRDEVIINPANQDIEPYQCVVAWTAVLPLWQIDCLLAGEFFPKFISILISWLSQEDPDYSEITNWYSGWKSVLPDALLTENNLSSKALALVLDIMEGRLVTEKINEFAGKVAPILQAMQRNNYFMLAKEYSNQERQPDSSTQDIARQHAMGSSTSTLKEVLELLAEQNGLIFAPKFGKSVQGKPIWEFGRSQIYMSNDVVYVMKKSADRTEWAAVTLADLLSVSA